MDRHWRKAVLRYSAVVLAVAVVVPVASGIAAETKAGAFPAQLVGRWTRTVTRADVKRAGVPAAESGEVFAGAVFTLTIQKNGSASLRGTGSWSGPIVPAGANRVHINLPWVFANVYRWRVSGRLLTFTKISDSDRLHFRDAVFWGVWKRK